jgi:hypothetical protein
VKIVLSAKEHGMNEQFAYSVNGEHYRGVYATREEALAEALAEARRCDDSPPMVYVARRVPGDAMASGHARAVIGNISSRAREEFGDTASSYLTGVSRPQVEKLDKALTAAIESWLGANGLSPTFFTYEAISSHPVAYGFAQQTVGAES